jgi:hypothetical protein
VVACGIKPPQSHPVRQLQRLCSCVQRHLRVEETNLMHKEMSFIMNENAMIISPYPPWGN